MKTRWMEYLAAALERGQARQRRSWQRTRRLGRRHYILQVVLYFWLMMVAFNFFASWIIAAYFHKPLVLLSPHRTWGEILVTMIFGTTGIYFVGARSWRLNERRYGEAPPCESGRPVKICASSLFQVGKRAVVSMWSLAVFQ